MNPIRYALCATLLLSSTVLATGCSHTPTGSSTNINVEMHSQRPSMEIDNLYSQMSGDLDAILLPEEI